MEYQNEMMASANPRQFPTIKFLALHKDFQLPTKAKEGDAAYDVVALSRTITDQYVEYGLGFATQLPSGWEGKVYPRSSISNYDLTLCNSVGIIDQNYRNEWKVRFKVVPQTCEIEEMVPWGVETNLAFIPKIYEIGDRVAQIQFQSLPSYSFELVEELGGEDRGGGFGSSGS